MWVMSLSDDDNCCRKINALQGADCSSNEVWFRTYQNSVLIHLYARNNLHYIYVFLLYNLHAIVESKQLTWSCLSNWRAQQTSAMMAFNARYCVFLYPKDQALNVQNSVKLSQI
jgi:hypothetical protein